ncbi:hypothetical protein H0H93_014906, partial [Arthromyces matolae]
MSANTISFPLQVAACGAIFFILKKYFSRKQQALPPGPPSLPIIGHAHLIPPEGLDLFFYELGKQYGDVIHLKALNKTFIVLNSVQAAVDLIDKGGSKYGGRPILPIYDILGVSHMFVFRNENDTEYLAQRKMFQPYFNKEKCKEYHSIQTREARILARSLVSSPGNHQATLLQYVPTILPSVLYQMVTDRDSFAAAIIVEIVFGHRAIGHRDTYIQFIKEYCQLLDRTGPPGATAVDFFPI